MECVYIEWFFDIYITEKNSFTMFWYLRHIEITDLLSEPTLLSFSFYGQWLTHAYLYVYLDSD